MSEPDSACVLFDVAGEEYAVHTPGKGWVFTPIKKSATVFPNFAAAWEVADKHYNPGRRIRVAIVRVNG
jgi:hypothetical protein